MKVADLRAYDCISRVSLLIRIVTTEELQGICPHHNNIFQSIFPSMAFFGARKFRRQYGYMYIIIRDIPDITVP